MNKFNSVLNKFYIFKIVCKAFFTIETLQIFHIYWENNYCVFKILLWILRRSSWTLFVNYIYCPVVSLQIFFQVFRLHWKIRKLFVFCLDKILKVNQINYLQFLQFFVNRSQVVPTNSYLSEFITAIKQHYITYLEQLRILQ